IYSLFKTYQKLKSSLAYSLTIGKYAESIITS
ncbi:hypothetical protein NPIL_565061, partial [Nephila pilipes]